MGKSKPKLSEKTGGFLVYFSRQESGSYFYEFRWTKLQNDDLLCKRISCVTQMCPWGHSALDSQSLSGTKFESLSLRHLR